MKSNKPQQEELNIFNFIAKLKQEKLFIESEKIDIQELNEKVKEKIHAIVKQSWFVNKRKLLLLHDIRDVRDDDDDGDEGGTSKKSLRCNYIGNDLDNASVEEAKNILGFQNAIKIANLLNMLRSQPKQLAQWLLMGEAVMASARDDKNVRFNLLLQSILNGFYGSCIFIEDVKFMLTLIYELAKGQLMKCDNPKNLIKQKTCTFGQLYYLFQDTYQPCNFFLSAALEMPILEVVSFSDHFLDIDHNKTIMRFRQDDGLNSYKDAVEYRNEIVSKLDYFTKIFIQSVLDNVFCFPKAIGWICFHIYKMIEQNQSAKEANAVIVELIFTTFLCPAIINPEQYGLIQSEISEMARHNLLQIAKILQILALEKYESIDKKYADIFIDIDKTCMSNFIEIIFDEMLDCNDGPPIDSSPLISRDIMLFSVEELNNLIHFLQIVHVIMRNENDTAPPPSPQSSSASTENNLSSLYVAILDGIANSGLFTLVPPAPSSSSSSSSHDNSPKSTLLASGSSGGDVVVEYIASNNQQTPKKSSSTNFFSLGSIGSKNQSTSSTFNNHQKSMLPLSFQITRDIFEPIGLLSEDKVIDFSVPNKNESGIFEDSAEISDSKENLTLDNNNQTSTGYADEAISEAASNHSVGSSLELENEDQNDNLSDMVSANVSGRGTPNISGRDTPSSQVSQVNENDDRLNVENQPENVPRPSQNLSRQIRSDIDDKFCKFEIKKLLEGDETFSIISDTWSTDVLASDNETLDLSDARNDRHHLQLVDQAIQEVPLENVLDISETRSESAWSTDVVTSDTERLTEIDNDDASSIAAQSDDTNSVARSDDMRSETEESAAAARRLSTCSSSCNVVQQQNYIASVSINSSNYVNVNLNSSTFSISTMGNSAFAATTMSTFKPNEMNSVSATTSSSGSNNYTGGGGGGFFREPKLPDCKTNGSINAGREMPKSLNFPPPLPPPQQQHQHKSSDQNGVASNTNAKNNSLIEIDNDSLCSKQTNSNSIMKKYNDRSADMLCSNSSLNSSTSGSSSNSFETNNKQSVTTNENSDQWEPKPWLNSSGSSLNATLTPSESTVELSLLNTPMLSNSVNSSSSSRITASTSTINPIGGAIRKTTISQLKPSASTGAIPKSISFDTSVDKGLDDDSRSKRSGFFGKLKNGFRYKKRSFRNNIYDLHGGGDVEDFATMKRSGGTHESPVKINLMNTDSSDDILAKYRAKPCCTDNSPIKDNTMTMKKNQNPIVHINADDINSFSDIKKKLRLALANTSEIPYFLKRNSGSSIKARLENILRLELAKRRRIKDWSFVGRISEALRCVKLLDEKSCLKLFDTMKTDIVLRSSYIQYLIESKQQLLFYDIYLNSLKEQIERDRIYCEIYFATRFVRAFVAEQETIILRFCDEFKQLSLADEKHDFLQNFYRKLYVCLNEDRGWQDKQKKLIKMALERYIISRVYTNAIYPNGDGDRDRDKVLHDHIENLSKIITPSHKDLMIPKIYLRESPWLPAQAALRAMDASKTPKDKLKCILRCARSIMDLLALSQSGSGTAATADDFTPVLVYVIIKVNPEALLSTIQFINSFQGQINGEEGYWWTQFCSAVEYIKTMDY